MKLPSFSIIFFLALFITLPGNCVFATDKSSQKTSISFTNIKTRSLLQLLTKDLEKNVIISENVSDSTTISLHNTTLREALNVVLQIKKLSKQETGNTIIITPKSEHNKNTQLESQPTAFNLHHASANNIAKLLKPAGAISQSGKVSAENQNNILIVTDTSDKISSLKNLLQKIDIPAKQILIEARIVSADENFARDLGLEFYTKQITNKSSAATTNSFGKFDFALAKLDNNSLLDLELAALESEGRGKIISSPKLLTSDRKAAYIESGSEIPYQEKTKEGNTSTTFKKAVLSLKVTPEVADKNFVNLILQLNQDKVSQLSINGVPAINTRKIQTQVLVKNGETIVLGGIYEQSKSKQTAAVPFLGKIPVLGLLFQKQTIKTERKELLMFVTPRIVG